MNSVNKFIVSLVKEACNEDVSELLLSKKNQQHLKTLITKFRDKSVKDPNAPKRPLSAYMFFCNKNRELVKKELGVESTMISVTRELGSRWREVKTNKTELAKYNKLAQKDTERHRKEMEKYLNENKSNPIVQKLNKKKNTPKHSKSAYLFFCEKYRPLIRSEHLDMSATDVTKELGKLWNELKNDKSKTRELKTYQTKSEKDKERYLKEKKQMENQSKEVVEEVVEEEEEVVEEEEEVVEEVEEVVEEKHKPKPKRVTKKTKKGKNK